MAVVKMEKFVEVYANATSLDSFKKRLKKLSGSKEEPTNTQINQKIAQCHKKLIPVKSLLMRGWVEQQKRGIDPVNVEDILETLEGTEAMATDEEMKAIKAKLAQAEVNKKARADKKAKDKAEAKA